MIALLDDTGASYAENANTNASKQLWIYIKKMVILEPHAIAPPFQWVFLHLDHSNFIKCCTPKLSCEGIVSYDSGSQNENMHLSLKAVFLVEFIIIVQFK